MPRIILDVEATAGSRVGRANAVGHSVFARSHHADGWPIGWGHITDTLHEDGHPLDALTLMTEPALPGPLHAWPIGLIRIPGHRPDQIIACVEEAAPFLDLIDLTHPAGWHADADDWLQALRRLQPHVPRHAQAHGGRAEAEALIARAQNTYQQQLADPAPATGTRTRAPQ